MFNPARQQTKTNQFLFHVAYPFCRKSIAKEGLIARENTYRNYPCVYAHNDLEPKNSWFPFCFDFYYVEKYMTLYDMDFWRIDTSKIDKFWFIDCALNRELKNYDLKRNFYVFCEDNIAPEAITLFRFQKEISYELIGNGAAHYRGIPSFRKFKI